MDKLQHIREQIARRLEYSNIAKIADTLGINRATLAKLKDPIGGNPSSETLKKVCEFFKL